MGRAGMWSRLPQQVRGAGAGSQDQTDLPELQGTHCKACEHCSHVGGVLKHQRTCQCLSCVFAVPMQRKARPEKSLKLFLSLLTKSTNNLEDKADGDCVIVADPDDEKAARIAVLKSKVQRQVHEVSGMAHATVGTVRMQRDSAHACLLPPPLY